MNAGIVIASLVRWVHILSAITAIGGTIFVRLVLHPSASAALGPEQREALDQRIARRWSIILHTCIGLLIATGVFNFIQAMAVHNAQPLYHALFGIKFLLAIAVFFLATALAGRSPPFGGLRKNASKWMTVNLILAAVVVFLSAMLKNIPQSL